MTSSYTRFSFALQVPSDRARDWLLELGRFIEENIDAGVEEYDADDYDLDEDDLALFWESLESGTGLSLKEHEFEQKNVVYIYAEESGDVDAACAVVQEYLKRFASEPEQYVSFPWVEYTDSNRIDGFDGGLAIITAKNVYRRTLAELIDERVKELSREGGAVPLGNG